MLNTSFSVFLKDVAVLLSVSFHNRASARAARRPGSSAARRPGSSAAPRLGSSAARCPGSYAARRAGSFAARHASSYAAHRAGSFAATHASSYAARRVGSSVARHVGSSVATRAGSSVARRAVTRAAHLPVHALRVPRCGRCASPGTRAALSGASTLSARGVRLGLASRAALYVRPTRGLHLRPLSAMLHPLRALSGVRIPPSFF
ncbi:unnamed protein product [Closterium sp. NIES-65]|nr:unnamed protein product [Closterium sp. NIES-65]